MRLVETMSSFEKSDDSTASTEQPSQKGPNGPVKNVPSSSASKRRVVSRLNQIPDEIVHDKDINYAISFLPKNYNFEIHKTIWRIRQEKPEIVSLQFPEGLLMYACVISDILRKFCGVNILIMGDVTYGACCVDDYTATKLGSTFLVHYGHSCLVPMQELSVKVLYVFVEISFDTSHLIDVILANFLPSTHIALMGTIQFGQAVHEVAAKVKDKIPGIFVGHAKPLSQGETLGCTAPILPADTDALVFIADGRFHLEAAMIQNPSVPAYRYDPYSKEMTREGYDTERMKKERWEAIARARDAKTFGLILGTLGRQGNNSIFDRIDSLLTTAGKNVVHFLMAEILPEKLAMIEGIDAWVQVACPRLSIDWGAGFDKPVLTPYELDVMLGIAPWAKENAYPMDYYSSTGSMWGNMYHRQQSGKSASKSKDQKIVATTSSCTCANGGDGACK